MADGTQPIEAPWEADAIRALFDSKTGWLDRRVHSDAALYQLELERIFARGWNFMCHEFQLPNVGDYFINYIGEDQVICVRDDEGQINVLLNTCRHRGNALCRAEQGRAKSFVCSYHGWNYALDGRLIGVPGQSTYYRGDLDESRLGLVKAAKVESYLGFYFATMVERRPLAARLPGRRRPHGSRHGLRQRRGRGGGRHPEEHHRLQLEDRRRQPLRLVPRDVQPRLGGQRRLCRPGVDRAPEEPDGDAGRLRAGDRRAGHPEGDAGQDRPDVGRGAPGACALGPEASSRGSVRERRPS